MKLNYTAKNTLLGFTIAGVVICFINCNFDSISKEELEKKYILKTSVKFKNLPKAEQKKYISKKLISQTDESFIDLDDKNIDENSIDSKDRLREIIKNLKSQISIVQNDNIQLSNSKEDMKKMIKKMKEEFKKSRDSLLRQNMKQINDTEQQHYKNISELTKKINDLQRENIRLSENNNIEIIALKAKINILNDKLSKLKKASKKK